MNDKESQKRLCGYIPDQLYLIFKNIAGHYFYFQKGYTQKAVESAVRTWVWMMAAPKEKIEALNEIGEREFNHIEDPMLRHEKMMEIARDEFIENHQE